MKSSKVNTSQLFLLLLISFFHYKSYTQNNLHGVVIDQNGNQLVNAAITIDELKLGTVTNFNGEFNLTNIPNGHYILQASLLGFKTESKKVFLPKNEKIVFQLSEQTEELDAVIIKGKGRLKTLEENVYNPSIIGNKKLRLKSTSLSATVSQLSGVRVREQGGLGSTSNIMINGISGKGIRVFVDNIPVSLLGKNFQLHQIPPSLINSIEIYKGIAPITFGSDALGGVVNISTRNPFNAYLDMSYTLGSWNTHLASINTKQFLGKQKKTFIAFDTSLDYSDNNYTMHNVPVLIDTLGNTKIGKARRFNDQYRSQTLRTSIGTQRVKWADLFTATIALNDTYKEWQHGITADRPWGEAFSKNNSLNTYVTWKKSLNNNQWNLQSIIGYNHFYERFTDTVAKAYYWDGNYVDKASKGESGFYVNGRTPEIKNENIFGRFLANHTLSKKHRFTLTSLLSHETIRGTDKAGTATFKVDFYKKPQKLNKLFIGASLESKLFNEKLTNSISLKYFHGNSKVANLDTNKTFINYLNNSYDILGYGNVIKYNFSNKFSSFLGYEYTVRLPDSEELFGDGISIAPNAGLEAERSHNINLGMNFKTKEEEFSMNMMSFYRNVDNQIFLRAINMAQSIYLNLHQTSTLGIEASTQYKPHSNITIEANATWFKQKLESVDEYGYLKKRYKGTRIPNTPYFFANGQITYTTPRRNFIIDYSANYVKSFFVSWESDGISQSKAKVPNQLIHNASISYNIPNNKLSISFECRNLLNQKAYDNYSVQKPERSFYLKTRYFIN